MIIVVYYHIQIASDGFPIKHKYSVALKKILLTGVWNEHALIDWF